MTRVLFVCLGNICRSPTAEGVFRQALAQAGLSEQVRVDSCGIGNWHIGKAPDARAQAAAARRGVDLSGLRARQVTPDDFHQFDYLLAMDSDNLRALKAQQPAQSRAQVDLLLGYAGMPGSEVPDPYYGGEDGFEQVLDMIERACQGLITEIKHGR